MLLAIVIPPGEDHSNRRRRLHSPGCNKGHFLDDCVPLTPSYSLTNLVESIGQILCYLINLVCVLGTGVARNHDCARGINLTDEEKKQLEEELARETATLADGFYKIFQKKTDKNSYATAYWTTGLQATSVVNVFMTGSSDDKGHFFKFTRQHGLKNSFTIVPADASSIPNTTPKKGATTFDQENSIRLLDES
ncbi:hypothetical protein K443DRAFT_8595 [Laccaria amethystina LaAM-08-1]|uniref:Uncharacterized protein n=1 Tax=Laccaria amethystina LaAM-08-1 TaxID=1095629 RepID=A0A0C9XCA7_9AGAR|nr:hypothetical protein K443DRAFT_8595 [Laccaria amethystina LaAM-08-1]